MARTVAEAVREPTIPFAIRWQSRIYSLLGLAALLVVVIVFATTFGSVHIPFTTTFEVLLSLCPSYILPLLPSTFLERLCPSRL